MKIFQMFKIYWPDNAGGIAKVMEDVSASFRSVNQSMIVCRAKKGEKTGWDNYQGIKVLRCRQLVDVFSTPVSIDFIRYAGHCIKSEDIVIYHFPYPMVDLAICMRQIQGRLIVWWHCDIGNHRFLMQIYKKMIHHTLERAERIVVSSPGIIKHSCYLQQYADKCRVIPFCVDDSYIEKGVRSFLDVSEKKEITILFVGRLVWYKGCHILLKAFQKMRNKKCRLVIAGSGPMEKELRKLAVRLHVDEKVCFEGRVSEVRKQQLLAECDFFVLPAVSKAEAFGIVQIEAMAFGKPVINTDLPSGVPEVSRHGITGITVVPGSITELAGAMEKLAGNAQLRQIYGKNAIRRVVDKYTQEQMYIKCRQLIEELNNSENKLKRL